MKNDDFKHIVFINTIPWKMMKQRPQYLAEELSNNFYVSFIEGPETFPKRIFGLPFATKNISKTLKLWRLNWTLPQRKIFNINLLEINRYLYFIFLIAILNKNTKYLFFFENPKMVSPFLIKKWFSKSVLIYDCVDIMSGFSKKNADIETTYENQIIQHSKIIFVVSRYLQKTIQAHHTNVHLVSNGVEYSRYLQALQNNVDIERQNTVRKGYPYILGYIGAVDDWFDFKVVETTLNKFLNVRFVIVGRLGGHKVKTHLAEMSEKFGDRFEYLGECKFMDVPYFIKYFDFGAIPFDLSHPVVQGVNPIKMYEYFAMGKAVIANVWDELKPWEDGYILSSFSDFFQKSPEFYLKNKETIVEKSQSIAQQNTWSQKAKFIQKVLSTDQ